MLNARDLLGKMEPLFMAIADPEIRNAADDTHVIAKAVASSIAVLGAAILEAMEDHSSSITHDLEALGELLDGRLEEIQKTVDQWHLDSTAKPAHELDC